MLTPQLSMSISPFPFNFHTYVLLFKKLLSTKIGLASSPLQIKQPSQTVAGLCSGQIVAPVSVKGHSIE